MILDDQMIASLQAGLDELTAQTQKKLTPEFQRRLKDMVTGLIQSGIEQDAPKVGHTAPDFTLPNAYGHPVKLSQL
jgi:hypothetical protein